MNPVAAILLAAGRSERMGAFKPLLPFGEQTVVDRCLQTIRAAGIEEIIVVLGHQAERMRGHLSRTPVQMVLNEMPESEMGLSISLGAAHLARTSEAVLIALCDQPAVPPEVISSLIEAQREPSALICIPEFGGRGGHPVLISLKLRDDLLNLVGRRGLRALQQAHVDAVRRVPVNSPYVLRDMDTWEDYRALHEEVFHSPPRHD